jgi:hypothetical protein
MTVKASAAGALMLAAGLFLSIAGPSPAKAAGSESAAASKPESATAEKSTKSSSRYLKKKRHAQRKTVRTASKSAEADKADAADRPAMSESAANAYAQMNLADTAQGGIGDSAKAMSARASTILLAAADNQADGQAPAEGTAVATPDQLNDVDKVLQESQFSQAGASQTGAQTDASQTIAPEPAAAQTVAMGQGKPAEQDNPAQVTGSDSLDKTSLIGKIFIAFGTLLTMASAARMFMA